MQQDTDPEEPVDGSAEPGRRRFAPGRALRRVMPAGLLASRRRADPGSASGPASRAAARGAMRPDRPELDRYGLPAEPSTTSAATAEGTLSAASASAEEASSPASASHSGSAEPSPSGPRAAPGATSEAGPSRNRVGDRPVYTGFMFAVGVGMALLIVYIAQMNSQLLVWIGAALFIALGLDPIVRGVERLGLPRPLGVLSTMLVFLGAVSLFIASITPTVTEQMSNFITSIPQIINDVSESQWFQDLDENLQIQDIIDTEVGRLLADPTRATHALGGIFGVGAAVLSTGFGVLVVAVLAMYFLASLPTMRAWGHRLVPRSRRTRVEYLGGRILDGIGYYVIGQACVAVLNGVVAFIAISIAGVPFGALFAVTVGILAFIPLVGPVIGGSLVTLVALTVDWQTAVTFAAIYFVYLQIEAYFVSPRIMARAVKIPAAVAVISVIAGGTLLGVLGALMAIPTAAAVMLLLREVLIARQDRR